MSIQNTLPIHKIDPQQQIIIDREPGQYLGQPDSILLNDEQTIFTVHRKNRVIVVMLEML